MRRNRNRVSGQGPRGVLLDQSVAPLLFSRCRIRHTIGLDHFPARRVSRSSMLSRRAILSDDKPCLAQDTIRPIQAASTGSSFQLSSPQRFPKGTRPLGPNPGGSGSGAGSFDAVGGSSINLSTAATNNSTTRLSRSIGAISSGSMCFRQSSINTSNRSEVLPSFAHTGQEISR